MKFIYLFFSILAITLFLIPTFILNYYSNKDIILLIENKVIFFTIFLTIVAINYLFFLLYILKIKGFVNGIFKFLTFLILLSTLSLTAFSVKLPFFNLKIETDVIELVLKLFFIFNLILIFITSIFLKVKNYFFIIIYRIILFVSSLFLFLLYFGNPLYRVVYQYVLIFSILIWKLIINITFIEKAGYL